MHLFYTQTKPKEIIKKNFFAKEFKKQIIDTKMGNNESQVSLISI